MERVVRNRLWICLARAFVAGAVLGALNPAHAHDWYSGTSDPQTRLACCGGTDCAPIDSREVVERPGGFLYRPTGEFIPQSRVQVSRDFRFHRCAYTQTLVNGPGRLYREGETRCFFAPPGVI
jgi:hypothetical protein